MLASFIRARRPVIAAVAVAMALALVAGQDAAPTSARAVGATGRTDVIKVMGNTTWPTPAPRPPSSR
jgi:hypothetical protein